MRCFKNYLKYEVIIDYTFGYLFLLKIMIAWNQDFPKKWCERILQLIAWNLTEMLRSQDVNSTSEDYVLKATLHSSSWQVSSLTLSCHLLVFLSLKGTPKCYSDSRFSYVSLRFITSWKVKESTHIFWETT
jgi:hypothetical protein